MTKNRIAEQTTKSNPAPASETRVKAAPAAQPEIGSKEAVADWYKEFKERTKRARESEMSALTPRGDSVVHGKEREANLSDLLACTLGAHDEGPAFERGVLKTLAIELHMLADNIEGGKAQQSNLLWEYVYALAERARGAAELGERSAERMQDAALATLAARRACDHFE